MPADWIELCCPVAADACAELEALLNAAGAASITLSGGDTSMFHEPGCDNPGQWAHMEIRALFAPGRDLAAVVADIRDHLAPGAPVGTRAVADRAWVESWKAGWKPRMFAGDLCVCPTWCDAPAAARHVVILEPGRAFGTGTHETTALCLDWLGGNAEVAGKTVIDYGCGSGILALAAGCIGAQTVFAVDVDEEALEFTRDNIRQNDLEDRVRTAHPGSLPVAAADILVANILLGPLLDLEPRFRMLLRPGGELVLSGVLAGQVAAVLEVYSARFNMDAPVLRGEWALLSGRRY